MPIPKFQELMLPLLKTLSDGQTRSTKDLRACVADTLGLTEEERREPLQSGQPIFSNRLAWAQMHLKFAELISSPERAHLVITESGKRLLAEPHESITCKFLLRYEQYAKVYGKWRQRRKKPDQGNSVAEDASPLELFTDSFEQLRNATAGELLAKLKACSPAFFEKVVVDLLVAMGYGGVTGEGKVTGKSNDGGIDGIIRQDKLGLDVVCVQAKRWSGSVGNSAVRDFVGGMHLHGAKKGVILTTSEFTSSARDSAGQFGDTKVVLIDGDTLVNLMIEHDIGVITSGTYRLKELSNDFFAEDEE